MKRGKDDDKVMGPMFPRLHVNDAVKGGPRAPPRNKMALYEQLTIPSQRMHSLPHGSSSTVAPSTSAIQVNSHEQNTYFPRYRPQLTSSYNEPQVNRSETVDLSNQLALGENRKQPLDEDDFMVPIFSHPGVEACNGNPQNSVHDERQKHLVLDNSTALPSTGDDEINHNRDLISKKRSSRISNAPRGYSSDILVSEEDGMLWKKDACTRIGYQEKYRMSSSEKTGISLRQDHDDVISVLDGGANGLAILDQPLENHAEDISLRLSYNPQAGCRSRGEGDNNIDSGLLQVEEYQSLEKENTDKGDDVSEASVVDTVTGLDICPDDVVRVIGPKHFWKARTAIAKLVKYALREGTSDAVAIVSPSIVGEPPYIPAVDHHLTILNNL